ncbi:exported hypothetical protein [Crenothrix polyspora]|uniref:Lipoprotein n=1 Tax=Crenothrix polyspora TaxID=360316 RepID=A0A1R4H379_9GAMM|nr:DUF6174 domain-containing protein [Crenothrix polyspora]SJM90309.1 exported hypothetical protein [Crenothrix polyspora]
MKKLLLVPLYLSILTACTTPTQPHIENKKLELPVQSVEAKQLQAAEKKWQQNQPTHYIYTLQRTCFCPREYNNPIEIRVLNGVVQKAMLPREGTPLPSVRMDEALTINNLFDVIHKAIDKKAASIDVKYDWRYGYPSSIAIDWEKMMADEETYFTARGLRPR